MRPGGRVALGPSRRTSAGDGAAIWVGTRLASSQTQGDVVAAKPAKAKAARDHGGQGRVRAPGHGRVHEPELRGGYDAPCRDLGRTLAMVHHTQEIVRHEWAGAPWAHESRIGGVVIAGRRGQKIWSEGEGVRGYRSADEGAMSRRAAHSRPTGPVAWRPALGRSRATLGCPGRMGPLPDELPFRSPTLTVRTS